MLLVACTALAYVLPQSPTLRTPVPQSPARAGAPAVMQAKPEAVRLSLSKPLGLPFDKLKETRSSSCPMGRAVGGLRVHRGYQDFGSYDTYEFQLQCLPERELREDGPVVHAGVLAELAARLPGVDVRAALTALLAQQRDGGKDEL